MKKTTNQIDNEEFDMEMIELLKRKEICKNWSGEMLLIYCQALRLYAEIICSSNSPCLIHSSTQVNNKNFLDAA